MAQSFKIKDRDRVKDIYDKELIKQADNYVLKYRFDLGTGYYKDYTEHLMKVLSMVCSSNCEFNDYFNKVLEEGRQDVTKEFECDCAISYCETI